MYYIFYKTEDGFSPSNDPEGAFLTQDISSYSLQQGDDIYIEWTLGVPDLLDNQLPFLNSTPFMTWSGASYSDTRVNVYVYGGDDGNGTAHGTLIMHHEMAAQSGSGVDFFAETFTFNRTLGSGVGAVTTTDTTRFNKIMFKVAKITSGQTFFIDDVDFGYDTTATDHWSLNANVINSNGTLIFSDGGQAVQNNTTGVESGKLYRVTAVFSTPDGYGVQNAIVSANGVGINADDPTANNPTYTQSGTVVSDVYFPSTTNDITIDVSGGNINILSTTIQEIEQYGGTVDCWDLNGGGDNFIFTSQASGGSIVFDEAPQNTYLHQELMNTNQALDFDIGINCTISFNITNYVGSGELTFMLYNYEGEGFEHTISGNGSYSFSSIIGNDSSSTLTSKFGFYVSSTNAFTGEIDNVDIVLDGKNIGKTISFNEKSKGWTSLKSFIPEVAISSVNQYYTMNFGQLWKHHQEFELDGTTVVDRNTFYGVFEESSVTPVLNTQPEVVKNFNTLNYEGSQSKVDMFTTDPATGLTDDQYYNLETKPGWYVEDIHTDKQEGTLNEFIEKEGKWFNYIKGKTLQVDTAAFNFQGLGIVETIQ